jgi:hypothetical protein
MPNYGYHLARTEARAVRRAYEAGLPLIVRRPIKVRNELPFEVFSYSSERDLPEQIASIRSLLLHAGRPRRFTVVSDGSHSARSVALLRAINKRVVLSQPGEWFRESMPERFARYLREHPTGKQLAVIMGLPVHAPALYIDSDVRFFPGAEHLADALASNDAPASYLPDCGLSADGRLFRSADETEKPVNTGVLVLRRRLDWSASISRFLELDGAATFFTNQTMTHLTMHANGAEPLDPRKFVLQLDDQFVYTDRYAGPDIVLRHYVNPVRHKFWTSLRQ